MRHNKTQLAALIAIGILLVGSAVAIEFDLVEIITGVPQMWSLIRRMLSPQWSYGLSALGSFAETLLMAVLGSLFGVLFALPLSLLAARNLTVLGPVGQKLIRGLLAFIRTIPHVLWAAILVTVFGIGRFAGFVALMITSTTLVTKLLSEYLENLDERRLDSLKGVGAGYLQTVFYAIWPEMRGKAWGLFWFSLETNTRAATVLGMVGAGGIGQLLWRDLNFLRYDRLATLVVMLFAIVALIDTISYWGQRLSLGDGGSSVRSYAADRRRGWLQLILGLVIVALGSLGLIRLLEADLARIVLGVQQSRSIIVRMTQVDLAYFYRLWQGIWESLSIALFATISGSLMAIPMAFASAANLWENRIGPLTQVLITNLIRTFPPIVLAVIFFRGLGPGPLAGALALTVHTAGVVAKLYTQILEGVERRTLDAVTATGAKRVQVWAYGIWPTVLPDFIAASLYRLESNIRTATILGIVGAGGIGTYLMMNLSARNWERVGLLMIGLIALITAADLFSQYIRRHIGVDHS